MKRIEWVNCSMIHKDLSTVSGRKIQLSLEKEKESKFIHEHYFEQIRLNGLNQFAICCTTCDDWYCNICGKLLGDKIITWHRSI
jgi:hypothetical protein